MRPLPDDGSGVQRSRLQPVPAGVALDVEARIHALVEEHRGELEAIADRAITVALDAIVIERVTLANGNGGTSTRTTVFANSGPRRTA
jgi:hypothetical protein